MHVANVLTCGPLLILSPALSFGDPPQAGKGYVATRPTFGPPLILSPALKLGDPPGGRDYVATPPTCGPPLILSPAVKRWGNGLASSWSEITPAGPYGELIMGHGQGLGGGSLGAQP